MGTTNTNLVEMTTQTTAEDTLLLAVALCQAASNGQTEVVERLVPLLQSLKINPHAPTICGSPLHGAAYGGHTATVKALIRLEADVHTLLDGLTALHIAAAQGHEETVKALIELGANGNALANGITPLHLAAKEGHTATVEVLIELGADVRILIDGISALHMAAAQGHAETVKALIALGADGNALVNGITALETALLIAAKHGHEETVEVLESLGANVNVQVITNGRTALHLAATGGHMGTYYALYKLGSSLILTDNSGRTALSCFPSLSPENPKIKEEQAERARLAALSKTLPLVNLCINAARRLLRPHN